MLAASLAIPAAAAGEGPLLRPWIAGETPALEGTGLDGRPAGLRALRGRVVLVQFWASWCEPCREELPALARLRTRLDGRPFAILSVNLGEGRARVETFLHALHVDLPVLLDPGRRAGEAWGVKGLPMAFLVDATGRVRSQVFGECDWTAGSLAAALESLLREAERGAGTPG